MWPFIKKPLPPPPPAAPLPYITLALLGLWACVLCAGLCSKWKISPQKSWLIWPIATAIFLVAQQECSSDVQLRRRCASCDPGVVPMVMALPVAGFGLLLVAELMTWLFALVGPSQHYEYMRHPVMVTHFITLIYYIAEMGPRQSLLITEDVFGRPLHPLRYMLWTISVSSMTISLFFVSSAIVNARGPIPEVWQKEVMGALLCVLGMVGFGFAASQSRLGSPSLVGNFTFLLLSTLAFYCLLFKVTRMLGAASRQKVIVERGLAAQFQVVQMTVAIVWHIFPLIWVVAAAQLISPEEEHAAYVLGDLAAKYMLLFVYITRVAVH